MAERPNIPLSQFTKRIEESSENHRSTISPRDNEIHKGGRMNDAERQRVVQESAAIIKRAVDGA